MAAKAVNETRDYVYVMSCRPNCSKTYFIYLLHDSYKYFIMISDFTCTYWRFVKGKGCLVGEGVLIVAPLHASPGWILSYAKCAEK